MLGEDFLNNPCDDAQRIDANHHGTALLLFALFFEPMTLIGQPHIGT